MRWRSGYGRKPPTAPTGAQAPGGNHGMNAMRSGSQRGAVAGATIAGRRRTARQRLAPVIGHRGYASPVFRGPVACHRQAGYAGDGLCSML